MSLEKDDDMMFIFYEEDRDRFRCIVKKKYVKSSVNLQDVVDARDKYLAKQGIDLKEVGVNQHKFGHWTYRRMIDGVRFEVFSSKEKTEVLKAKEIFDGRFRSGKISLSKIEDCSRNGHEQNRSKLRIIPKNNETIWGDSELFV